MAQQYAIEDTTMTALANAVRGIVGETRQEISGFEYEDFVVSKTSNASSFTEYDGGYGNGNTLYDVIHIPGATKIVVDIAYQTESVSYDYVQIDVGELSSPPSTTKYGGTTRTRKTLTYSGTDTITIYFKSDGSTDSYLGYYAECRGYDDNGNLVQIAVPVYSEVINDLTIDEMITGLTENGAKSLKYAYITTTYPGSTTSAGGSYTSSPYFDLGHIINRKSKFISVFVAFVSNTMSSNIATTAVLHPLVLYYDGAGTVSKITTGAGTNSNGTDYGFTEATLDDDCRLTISASRGYYTGTQSTKTFALNVIYVE